MNFEKNNFSENKNEVKMFEEADYIKAATDYALAVGWVRPEQIPILIEHYLKPIHKKYRDLVAEVAEAIEQESEPDIQMETIIRRLNAILDATRRIGSTDPANIGRSIFDYRSRFCRSNVYLEYAANSLAETISKVLSQI